MKWILCLLLTTCPAATSRWCVVGPGHTAFIPLAWPKAPLLLANSAPPAPLAPGHMRRLLVRVVRRRANVADTVQKPGRSSLWSPLPIFALLTRTFKKRHIFRIFAYYALGAIVYGRLEGWSVMNSIYFTTVTATTVGYGDLCPATQFGKLFSLLYSILGFTVVMAAIAPLLSFLQGSWREKLLESIPLVRRAFLRKVDLTDMSLTIHDVNKRINYPRRYALCLMGPLLVFALVAVIAFTVEGLGFLDSAYFSLITMSTIGYGDLSPSSKLGKAMAVVYLPLAVIALADAISGVAAITTRRMIRRRDYAGVADELLLRNCVRNGRNPDFSLREAEFMVAVLLANDILDSDTINVIRRQFRNMVRNAEHSNSQNVSVPPLTPKMIYAELVERGRVPADRGFEQWYKEEWVPRVQTSPKLPLGSAIDVPNFPDV